ncbi:MAG: peptidoglycan-binding domain-containing protein [Myxococcota bacterium]
MVLAPIARYRPAHSISDVDAGRATLGRGDSGSSVEELQRKLNAAGANPPLVTDGLFGPKTEAALKSYQASQGLPSNGLADHATLAGLSAARPAAPARAPADNSFARTDAPAPRAPDPTQPAPSGSVPARDLIQSDEARRTADRVSGGQPSGAILNLPPRRADAMTGSQFLESTKGMSRADREAAILREIQAGNVPDFARQMKEVQVSSVDKDGQRHTGTIRVMPDYLAIGSDKDFVRIPMDPLTAQKIADQTGTSLPTKKIVDDVYKQAEVKLRPQPLPAGPQMMSNDYYARHQGLVESQRQGQDAELGALTAGHQKDVVITNRLADHPDRVAIYGWHQPNGKPIQPLSTVHENTYADYSHGVRLVSGTMVVDGVERPIAEVLQDPKLAGLVSDEGAIRRPRY